MTRRTEKHISLPTEEERSFRVVYDLYTVTAKLYRRKLGADAKELIKKWSAILNSMDGDLTDKTDFLADRIKIMIDHLDSGIISYDGTPKPKEENPIVEDYNAETITDMRSRYIAQTIVQSEEKTLDSGQVRVLLNQKEGKPFHRSMVSRVIKNLPKFLSCKVDLYAGKLRVMRIDPFFVTNHRSGLERSGL